MTLFHISEFFYAFQKKEPFPLFFNSEVVGMDRGSITRLFTLDSRDSKYPNKKARLRGPFVLTACFLLVPVVRVGPGLDLNHFRLGRGFTAVRIMVCFMFRLSCRPF